MIFIILHQEGMKLVPLISIIAQLKFICHSSVCLIFYVYFLGNTLHLESQMKCYMLHIIIIHKQFTKHKIQFSESH